MAVKSAQAKSLKSKKREEVIGIPESLEEEALPVSKIKAPIEVIEEEEEVLPLPLEDKADPLAVEEETDEFAGDEMGLDEEIDPFGDKWES